MLANELIDQLERRGLLDQEIIEALREQLSQGGSRVTPEAVAKLLVDNGQLTRFQATKLIGELRSETYESEAAEVVEGDEDLTAQLIDDDEVAEAVVEVEDAFGDDPVEVEAIEAEPVAVVAEAESIDDSMGGAPARPRPSSARIKKPETKSTWDSFKIYGYLGIIGFLVIAGGILWFVLSKGNADEFIALANKQYDSQSYQPAQDAYIAYLDQFGESSQYSSLARTRITMCELFRAEQMTDPVAGLEMAKEKLPTIIDEEAMNDERGNLAGLLVDVAENLANAAQEAKETEEKRRLLGRLDEQQELIDNPNYMLSTMKTTLSGRLLQITEARNRVRREIDRNVRLDETEAAMKTALENKNTKEAYDQRISLLRDFPELVNDPRLVTLIEQASDIQQTLVRPSAKTPKISTEPADDGALRSIVLTTRQGDSVPGVGEEVYFLRAGGSVLAFAVDDGRLLWRDYTGQGEDYTPLRLDDGMAVLLSDMANDEIRRCRGEDGEVEWRAAIGESFAEPVAGRDSVLVTLHSGTLVSMDSDSGDVKWSTDLSQELSTPAGLDDTLNRIYIPGGHSNLYVLNARDGKCIESLYLGHEEGTIAVAPVSLLGHLFVIENAGSDYAQVHVLKVDEKGEKVTPAQPPFRLSGNVVVPPIIQNRRLIVLTDRGQVAVYDIEPTSENEQVSLIAQQVAAYDKPTLTRMAVGRSQMWITGTRIGRYELQINTGRVVYDWGKNEGDTFIGQPLSLDDVLVHARILKGTSAIRVTAAEPKTGRELWRTDVGTPIAMITPAPESGFHAVTSQGALFELTSESLASGSTQGPIENPGANGISMSFQNPIEVDDTRRVLLNQAQKGEALIYDPTRRSEKLRKVTFQLTGPKPVGVATFSGGGLFLPLDTGRAVLMDWQTGRVIGAPFQPASDPTATVQWTNPVKSTADPDQVLIADSRKKLYRLRVGEQIRELSSVDLEAPFLGSAAAVDSSFIAGASGPASDFLVGHDQTGLEQSFKKVLEGRIVWGPVTAESEATGQVALVITDDQVLRAFSATGEALFQTALPEAGKPVDEVVSIGGRWVLTGRDGWLTSIDPATGEEVGTTRLGQPLSASPLPVGNKLLVPGTEGVVYITNIPGDA
ncbi:outer membrane protein assembly factor BamB family protein [Rhodopirellula halodulae]|uniref:outer membrane protein assembly factor BamB family protein n=1 Tax=Rhodopirellula halodulae TaxID=2894198 RepID=UPI001E3EDED2|nr:PQQ-binding-like beta-propeller repeat protein [Rhodopirellula sp. JC737]MCC9654228.1 PQQ-binding-like beta-propeller repeat protein [Rhodopirellula sp. JC737]